MRLEKILGGTRFYFFWFGDTCLQKGWIEPLIDKNILENAGNLLLSMFDQFYYTSACQSFTKLASLQN